MAELITFAKSGGFAPSSAALSPFQLPVVLLCLTLLVGCFGPLHQQKFSWEGGEVAAAAVC